MTLASWKLWGCRFLFSRFFARIQARTISHRNALELSQITPLTAPYYSFHATSTTPLGTSLESQTVTLLDPTAALEQLLAKGCVLATKPWVDNHWAMILWKLAGMVCLDPERESDGREKRWSWGEVMRQLLYR